MKSHEKAAILALRNLMAALQNTNAHSRLCASAEGWGHCDCRLSIAMRKAEIEIIKSGRRAAKEKP